MTLCFAFLPISKDSSEGTFSNSLKKMNNREGVRQRKVKEDISPPQHEEKQRQSKRRHPTSSISCFSVIKATIYLLIASSALSYIFTSTWTWNYNVPLLKYYYKWKTIGLFTELILTEKELAKHDGSRPKRRLYLAINGSVYDVTAGKNFYGKGGGYSFFTGRDAARSFVTGCFKDHLTHDLRGLTESELDGVRGWAKFYENSPKYFYVGKVVHPPIDPKSPIPKSCKEKDQTEKRGPKQLKNP